MSVYTQFIEFKCSGGMVVYPQLYDTSGNKVWDGRDQSGFRWKINEVVHAHRSAPCRTKLCYRRTDIFRLGQLVTVDLVNDAGRSVGDIATTGFNVVAGEDGTNKTTFTVAGSRDGKASGVAVYGSSFNNWVEYKGTSPVW